MADKNFTAKDILQKEFAKSLRGYEINEVDEFLDDIIRDYDSYQKEVSSLRVENERLLAKVEDLNKQLASARANAGPASNTQPTGVTNFDILKRLSNLEKHVFGAKIKE